MSVQVAAVLQENRSAPLTPLERSRRTVFTILLAQFPASFLLLSLHSVRDFRTFLIKFFFIRDKSVISKSPGFSGSLPV